MQNPLTDISCIAGLIIIFILAGIFQANFFWIAGVIILLMILVASHWLGELSRRTNMILALLSWVCTISTVAYLILFNL
jgi:ABC-type iron transport system FetAB permease component